jgi:hypothetical protein
MHLVGYLYEDYHDARSLEHKVKTVAFELNFGHPYHHHHHQHYHHQRRYHHYVCHHIKTSIIISYLYHYCCTQHNSNKLRSLVVHRIFFVRCHKKYEDRPLFEDDLSTIQYRRRNLYRLFLNNVAENKGSFSSIVGAVHVGISFDRSHPVVFSQTRHIYCMCCVWLNKLLYHNTLIKYYTRHRLWHYLDNSLSRPDVVLWLR